MDLMRSSILSLLVIIAATAGCATGRNTLAQDLAWERWTACDHFTAVTLDRIELDGRIIVNGYENTVAPFTACVHTVAADQSRGGAVAMPQSLVLAKIYGCQGGAM
jgi:hypothetical protein